ncbi:hypothetical protein ACHAXR_000675, partial [Thalassiosira sp. AJA248-18]
NLAAAPLSSPLFFGHRRHHQPSFLKLDAQQRQPFSELESLKAKRLSLRRRLPEPEAVASVANHDDIMPTRVITPGLEYLYETGEERHSDDLFHIILMPSYFPQSTLSTEHSPKTITEVLRIPSGKGHDLSLFAKHQGFSCLGTWTREECLSLGEELLSR